MVSNVAEVVGPPDKGGTNENMVFLSTPLPPLEVSALQH